MKVKESLEHGCVVKESFHERKMLSKAQQVNLRVYSSLQVDMPKRGSVTLDRVLTPRREESFT